MGKGILPIRRNPNLYRLYIDHIRSDMRINSIARRLSPFLCPRRKANPSNVQGLACITIPVCFCLKGLILKNFRSQGLYVEQFVFAAKKPRINDDSRMDVLQDHRQRPYLDRSQSALAFLHASSVLKNIQWPPIFADMHRHPCRYSGHCRQV